MITKELAKEILTDIGFTVDASLQFYNQEFNVDLKTLTTGYVYIGLIYGNSVSGVVSMATAVALSLKGAQFAYNCSNGDVAVGQSTKDAVVGNQVFVVFDNAEFSIESGMIYFQGYRLKI